MLRHGLHGLEGQRIVVPSRRVERPDEGKLDAFTRVVDHAPPVTKLGGDRLTKSLTFAVFG